MITGIVLSGGKSSRMGFDKCLAKYKNKYLIEYAIEALEPITKKILISSQKQEHFQFGYKLIEDIFLDCGPIAGIYSTISESETETNIIVPCDMPFISNDLLRFLLENKKQYDAVIPVFNDKIEPLVGVFSKNILPIIKKRIELKQYKILSFLQEINTNFINVDTNMPFYNQKLFTNINLLKDLNDISTFH